MKKIDTENWNRKEHFEFFSKMKSPYLGITANIKCTRTYRQCKENGTSFFARYFYLSMLAANRIPELRQRIIGNDIYEFEKINAGTTIAREDGTFGFIWVGFDEDFNTFNERLQQEIREVQHSTGLRLNNDDLEADLIRHTTIPWVSFTSLLHPTDFGEQNAVPKISFGKIFENHGDWWMPVNIEAHHGLVDGIHIARYFHHFEKLLNA